MRRARLAAAALLFGIASPRFALAQGESAEPLPARTVRLTIGADWHHWTNQFGTANPLNPGLLDGTREPIGTYLGSDSLGTTMLPFLAPTETMVRGVAGLPGWGLDVGRAKLTLDASWRNTPIRLEIAPSSRFGVSVNVPLVRARMSAFLALPDTGVKGSIGNVGYNPVIANATTYDAFRLQADTALRALRAQIASGPAALQAQAQQLYTFLKPLACGLYALGKGSSTDPASPCYSATMTPGAPLLPVDTSAAGDSITSRLGAGETSYANLAAQYAAAGVTMPTFTSGYLLPAAPLDSAGIRRLFYDPTLLGGDSLNDVVRTRLGDVELGAWLQLVNGPHWRSQVAVNLRLPTGSPDNSDNFIDLATGTHERGVLVAFKNDVITGSHLWFHLGGSYATSTADQLDRRITPWYLPFVLPSASATVERKLGDAWGLDLVPNVRLDDAFGVSMGWHWFHQAATSYSYVNPGDQARIGLPADVLGEATEVTRMRVGFGVTFSTLARYDQGRARLPYRVTWSYNSTIYGRGGQVPQDGIMQLMVQAYFGSLR